MERNLSIFLFIKDRICNDIWKVNVETFSIVLDDDVSGNKKGNQENNYKKLIDCSTSSASSLPSRHNLNKY